MLESPPIPPLPRADAWHYLLNTRYVCEFCLTRFFVAYHNCPACHQIGYVRPLITGLASYARNDEELRHIIAHGQTLPEFWPAAAPPAESGKEEFQI